jgi:hypothetical protein
MPHSGLARAATVVSITALFSSATLAATAADAPAGVPFGPPSGTASASYHTIWSTPSAHLANGAPLTVDETVTATRGDDGTLSVAVGDKVLGTLDATGEHLKRVDHLGALGNLGDAFAHLVGIMRGHPSLVDGATWKGGYTAHDHGVSYDVPLDVTVLVRGDTLHVSAQGQGSGALLERAGDSTIVESADYAAGVLQKASGHETTVERWSGANNRGTSTNDITWSIEAK